MKKTRIAIIGGGLSGLSLADRLIDAGLDVHLFEARNRFGGRVKTRRSGSAGFDLGPSWYWPGQTRMAQLVQSLGLTTFDQYAKGALLYETETGEVHRDQGFSSMRGSWRIDGGMSALIDGLVHRIPPDRLHLGHRLNALSQDGTLSFETGAHWIAEQVVLAVPPRIAAGLAFSPPLPAPVRDSLAAIPTWMGGHAKFVALYDHPFWRDAGLSGDAMSRRGPLMEIHDASARTAHGPAALFGFLGTPARIRQGQEDAVTRAALHQLASLFGQAAAQPKEVLYQDWATRPDTATVPDLDPPRHHPAYGMPSVLEHVWQGRVRFCVTELAPEMGGYLEGALATAETTASALVPL